MLGNIVQQQNKRRIRVDQAADEILKKARIATENSVQKNKIKNINQQEQIDYGINDVMLQSIQIIIQQFQEQKLDQYKQGQLNLKDRILRNIHNKILKDNILNKEDTKNSNEISKFVQKKMKASHLQNLNLQRPNSNNEIKKINQKNQINTLNKTHSYIQKLKQLGNFEDYMQIEEEELDRYSKDMQTKILSSNNLNVKLNQVKNLLDEDDNLNDKIQIFKAQQNQNTIKDSQIKEKNAILTQQQIVQYYKEKNQQKSSNQKINQEEINTQKIKQQKKNLNAKRSWCFNCQKHHQENEHIQNIKALQKQQQQNMPQNTQQDFRDMNKNNVQVKLIKLSNSGNNQFKMELKQKQKPKQKIDEEFSSDDFIDDSGLAPEVQLMYKQILKTDDNYSSQSSSILLFYFAQNMLNNQIKQQKIISIILKIRKKQREYMEKLKMKKN